jgi:F-type H+-transporting ATPase subunit delta
MSQSTVARRYATALYEEADRTDVVEAVDADVELIRNSLEASDDLMRFFESPVIPDEKKGAVIDTLFEDRVDALTHRFLKLLVKKDREGMVAAVAEQYQALRDEQRNIVEAHVRTAQPMGDDEKDELTTALEQTTGKNVRLKVEEDADLIGGLVVRIGDRVYDGSVRNKLENLRDRFRQGRIGTDTPPVNGNAASESA